MPGSADFIQRAVHALEAGGLAVWIRRVLVFVVIFALAFYYLWHFRGLATPEAMDQAQVGRAIASGKGWSTNFARPLAIGLLQSHGRNPATAVWKDTYNAPLPPLANAVALLAVKSRWIMAPTDLIYAGDRAIAFMEMIFFLLSVVTVFFTIRRLFDKRLAIYVCALAVLSDIFWQYSLSGLPQMLLLLLFNGMLYFLVRAVQAKYDGLPVSRWIVAVGLMFGLLALTHALTIWIFAGVLIFSVFFFAPRGWAAAMMLAAFALVYLPWLIRTWVVSGTPGGIALYTLFDGIEKGESGWMRQLEFNPENIGFGPFRARFSSNLMTQLGRLFELLGWNAVAACFFVALLHPYRRLETASIRWLVLAMWGGATLGMAVYGLKEEQGFGANQLHLLFIPVMSAYGLAFLLVQWNRLDVKLPFARPAFIGLLFLISCFPLVNAAVLTGRKPLIMWPPYLPPYIAVLHAWMQPNELVASDMPWAVAWYADRRSVWLPDTVKNFIDLSDYKTLGGPINGLYLTPISGSGNRYGDIVRGEYKDWGQIILRTANLQKFPLKFATLALGTNEECLFLSDTDRTKIKTR
jgi:hypothetical protein